MNMQCISLCLGKISFFIRSALRNSRKKYLFSFSFHSDFDFDAIYFCCKIMCIFYTTTYKHCLDSNGVKFRYTQSQREVETKSRKYRKIREELTNEANMQGTPYNVCVPKKVLQPNGFDIYLKTFFATFPESEEFYSKIIFRKLKLNSYINTQKSESKFLKGFRKKFGKPEEASVFIGDWDSGGHTLRGQISTKGKGFRKMFRQSGYQVYLVNEYRTSKTCPCCHLEISTFKRRLNPKPWKKENLITVHGLLRCQSEMSTILWVLVRSIVE